MKVKLGVDSLTYHCRLAAHGVTLVEIVDEIADLGFEYLQLNAIHLDGYSDRHFDELLAAGDRAGITFTLSGGMVGRAADGDTVESGVARVLDWFALATRVRSPYMRVSSGFYRNELAGTPGLIKGEQQYVIAVATEAVKRHQGGEQLLLENHSDFTPDEYVEIIRTVGPEHLGVFLDVINPLSVLADPVETVEKLLPWAWTGHVKDYRMDSHYVPDRVHRRGFDVQWCYPGEGVADLSALIGRIVADYRSETYHLAIEGLDNYPDRDDQRERLGTSLTLLRDLVGA